MPESFLRIFFGHAGCVPIWNPLQAQNKPPRDIPSKTFPRKSVKEPSKNFLGALTDNLFHILKFYYIFFIWSFDWPNLSKLNIIMSGTFIWNAYGLIAHISFLDVVYQLYISILQIRNGSTTHYTNFKKMQYIVSNTKNWLVAILQKDNIYCFQYQKLIKVYICFNINLRFIYNKWFVYFW